MSLYSVSQLASAENNGQSYFACWKKAPTQTTGANYWFDLNMSPGSPPPNYYIGTPSNYVPNGYVENLGIPHGQNVNAVGYQKYLKTFMLLNGTASAVPLPCILYDNVGFYPFLDESTPGVQPTVQGSLPQRWIPTQTAYLGSEVATQVPVSGTSGFTASANCTLSNPGSVIQMNVTAASPYAQTTMTVVPEQTYRCEFQFSGFSSSAGAVTVYGGTTSTNGVGDNFSFAFGANGTINTNFFNVTRSFTFVAKGTTFNFNWGMGASALNGDTSTLNYLSVKPVMNMLPASQNQCLQMMPTVVAGHSGIPVYFVQYTNQDGLPNRWAGPIYGTTQAVNGTILSASPNSSAMANTPFLTLQYGDIGVRTVDSIMFTTLDVGLISMGLVRPIVNFALRTIDAPVEMDFFKDWSKLPTIPDDAGLAIVCNPQGTLAATIFWGSIQTIWG